MPARPQRSTLAAETGTRLRQLRESSGLSLGALAKQAGVGKGTLSELESGRRNPTLETLFALTTALGVPISAVLPPGEARSARAEGVTGQAIEAVLIDRFADPGVTTELYRVTVGAGLYQRSAPHATGVTEHWVMFAGELELGPIGAPVRLASGQSTTFAADVPHDYRAGGEVNVAATLLVRYPG